MKHIKKIKMKISNKKLKSLIAEEKQASKEYRAYGFRGIAKQERSHAVKLAKVLRSRK